MAFKFYLNKKTMHPSISIRQTDKKKWHNIPITHKKPRHDSSIEIDDPHPKAHKKDKAYVQRFVRKDKRGVKGHPYREYKLNRESEDKIKKYLKQKYKKR